MSRSRRPRRRCLPLLLILAACAAPRGPSPDADLPTRLPAAARVVAIGDLHGDLSAARRALRLAGAIDERDRWIGGRLVVVQTGDQLDRGGEERALLDLLDRLAHEAYRVGGAVIALNGNHELMNALLDFRYVTPEGFRDFAAAVSLPESGDSLLETLPPERRARAAAFRPGGPYARRLARRVSILVVGTNLFVHAGVLPEHAAYGIELINGEIRAWLRTEGPRPPWVSGADAPVWTRRYSADVDSADCAAAEGVLRLVAARRMIVGHTVQSGGITRYCGGLIWAVDVGMAAVYGGPVQVLEVRGDSLRPLHEADSSGS
jgi:hypothetical protein